MARVADRLFEKNLKKFEATFNNFSDFQLQQINDLILKIRKKKGANVMKEERNDSIIYRLILIGILTLIASILMIIFTIPKAKALEFTEANYSQVVNGTTYYGYNLPTRAQSEVGTYGLYFTSSMWNTSSTTSVYRNQFNGFFYQNGFNSSYDYESNLINYANEKNVDLNQFPKMRTQVLVPNDLYNSGAFTKVQFGFSTPNESNVSLSDMLSNPQSVAWDYNYSMTFDVILFNNGGGLGGSISQSNPTLTSSLNGVLNSSGNINIKRCVGTPVTDFTQDYYSSVNCQTIPLQSSEYQIIYNDSKLQYVRITVPFTYGTTFSNNWHLEDHSEGSTYTNVGSNFFFIIEPIQNYRYNNIYNKTYMYVSAPYNLIVWTTHDKEACQFNCSTQEDTDNINKYSNITYDNFNNDFLDTINGLLGRNYGFAGIVNITYNFIRNVLLYSSSYNCTDLSIPVLSTNIKLPCASSFWGRSDISSFESFYNLLWLGIVSYILGWKIYKDLVNVLNPYASLFNRKEVDSL